tara:strand:- start:56 stop:607 length:552 start_codon:yes stop_codon:yes gene_type:complete
MPFKSDKQKRWMYANKPEMAKEWSAKEDNEEPYGILDATVRDFEQELDIQGDGIDTNVNELKDYVDIIKGLDINEGQRKSALKYLMNLRGPGGRVGLEDVDFEFVFGIQDNEEDYERFEDPYDDYVDDDAREQARRDDELMGDIKVDTDSIPKRPDLKKGMKDLDDKIKQMQFKDFFKKRNGK